MSVLLHRLVVGGCARHYNCIPRHKLLPSIRQLETTPEPKSNSTQSRHKPELIESSAKWITIYHLPLARLAAAFNRLKIYQGALTTVGAPLMLALEQNGQVALNTTAVVGAIGFTGLLTLTIASTFFKNLIGFVYIDEAGEKVKLAYVDFWGRRQELTVDIDDLAPVFKQSSFSFYQPVHLHSDKKQKFKLIQKFGIIQEPLVFTAIFGE